MTAPVHPSPLAPEALHQSFLSILPRIEVHARVCFRWIKCPDKRDDAIAETVAVAWKWFVAQQLALALGTTMSDLLGEVERETA